MKFNKELIMKSKTVVHCKTKEETNILSKWADSAGLKWYSGSSYLNYNCYYYNEEKTCYNLKDGGYSHLDYYKENGYKILSFEEAKIEEEKIKEKKIITNIIGKNVKFYTNEIKIGTIIAIGQDSIETNDGINIYPVFIIVLEDGTVFNEYTANCEIIL